VSAVTFTPDSWHIPHTVTVTGADDDVSDGDISFSVIVAAATSDDSNYAGLDDNDRSNGNDINLITIDGTYKHGLLVVCLD
jgi:hypothetical protein